MGEAGSPVTNTDLLSTSLPSKGERGRYGSFDMISPSRLYWPVLPSMMRDSTALKLNQLSSAGGLAKEKKQRKASAPSCKVPV
jgi:hypothetical protein